MACRNAEGWLDETLGSALEQDYRQLEVIAIDDASDDATPSLLEDAERAHPGRLKVARNVEQRGVAMTRQGCLERAEGDFICILDADDTWLPGKVTRQVEVLLSRTDAAVVHTGFEAFDDVTGEVVEWGRSAPVRREGFVLRELWLKGNFVAASSVMIRRSALAPGRDAFSDLGFPGYDDYFLMLALALDHPFAYIDTVLLRYRRHGGSLTSGWVAGNMHEQDVAAMRAFASNSPQLRRMLGRAFGKGLARHSLDAATLELASGRRREALAHVAIAARFDPLSTAAAFGSHISRRVVPRHSE
jgi:glycosyltransferase involved in cell wall biosynthesis